MRRYASRLDFETVMLIGLCIAIAVLGLLIA